MVHLIGHVLRGPYHFFFNRTIHIVHILLLSLKSGVLMRLVFEVEVREFERGSRGPAVLQHQALLLQVGCCITSASMT